MEDGLAVDDLDDDFDEVFLGTAFFGVVGFLTTVGSGFGSGSSTAASASPVSAVSAVSETALTCLNPSRSL